MEKRKIEQGGGEENGGGWHVCVYISCWCFKKLTLLRYNLPIIKWTGLNVHGVMSSDRCDGPVSLFPSEDPKSHLVLLSSSQFSLPRGATTVSSSFFFLATLYSLWNLSSPTSDRTRALSSEHRVLTTGAAREFPLLAVLSP